MTTIDQIIKLSWEYLSDDTRRPTLAGGDIEERLRSCIFELVGLMEAARSVPHVTRTEGRS